MKVLNSPPKFIFYCIAKSLRHPKQPITYYLCGCGCRFPASGEIKECPKCGEKIENSPEHKAKSAIPWWGSIILILIGIICWVTTGFHNQLGLAEAGRAMVYIPLGSIFGMSLKR